MAKSNIRPRLFICGDSFCFPDPQYGPCWVDLIQIARPNIEIVNLSSPGASNYLISLQVQHALENKSNWIIYHATSSIRQEFSISRNIATKDSIDRYWNPLSKQNKAVVSNSWISATRNTDDLLLEGDQTIKRFFTEYIDLPSMINKNYIFIDYTLKLLDSSLPRSQWAWSPGGFEHKNFSDSVSWDFSNFQNRICKINLWDDYDNSKMRPYYHVTDPEIHQKVCETYLQMLDL
jgi:hypothetical protein